MSLSEVSILIVDDEEVVRKSFTRELQQEHFTVTAVASGSEAINALENAEYDLVITDLMMLDVDGFKVLKIAKKLAPLTSVIILTGYGDTQSAIDALRLGADDFLRKPCEIEELVFRIRSCLVKRNLLLERKKVMQELQESKTFNLATLNALSAEIAVLDFNGLIVAVNDSWRNFALENGLEADKLAPNVEVGTNYLSVCKAVTGLESDDALKSYEGIQSVLDGRLNSFNLEYPCHSSKQERWFKMNVSPLILENQRHVVVAHTNITELKKTEEALRQSEQRRCLALESAQAGTWEWDLQTNTSIWSDQLWALHELEPRGHEISYEEWRETLHPDDQLKTEQAIKKNVLQGTEINVEWRVKLNNEKERWLMSRGLPLRDGQDRVVRYLGTIIDITQRKQAEQVFRESEEKYRTVANFAYGMEAWRMPDGTYRYISPSCERVTGYTATEFLADPNFIVQITHPDDRARVIEHYFKALHKTNRQNMGLDFRILTPGGEIRWISHSCTAVCDEGGKWLGRRQSNREITNSKQMEEALRKSEAFNQQLQKNESLNRMAGAIAHVFNNQLGAVVGNLELALQDLPLDAEPAKRIASAIQAAFKAAEVSGLMNTYLGYTTGKHAPLNLFELCRKNLPLLQAASTKSLLLDVDLLSPDPTINGNTNQIQQVLVNLITNAWEALGESQGDINLTLKTVSPGDIAEAHRFPFDWKAQNVPYACMEVKDTGCGIANEDIDKIFDPFFSRKLTGRGLGLSVVLGILKAHNGAIAVESETGRGSIFRVLLPISSEVVPIQLNKAAQLMTGEWAGTVLLVEDEQLVREMTNALLEQLGFTVLLAQDGVEAEDIYRKCQGEIHCVICDFKTTPKDGYEIFNTLRQINPKVKFVISSGYDKEEILACFAGQGLNGFIQKPFSQADFAAEVLDVLEKEERKIT